MTYRDLSGATRLAGLVTLVAAALALFFALTMSRAQHVSIGWVSSTTAMLGAMVVFLVSATVDKRRVKRRS